MASGPTTSWQIEAGKVEAVTDFIFLGAKIIVDGDCSREIKRWLLLGRKAMTKLDNILKRKDITLLTKICIVKAIVFPVVMYGCENWTIKKAECWRIDAFELWFWRRLFFFLSLVFFSRIQEAWGWCTGMTQKDGMGREVGRGFRIGNTCTPVVDSCWCMAKPIQYCPGGAWNATPRSLPSLERNIRSRTHA